MMNSNTLTETTVPGMAVPCVLETRNLLKKFGGITATDHVNLSLKLGARHALIGPNGAGKTTTILTLLGLTEADTYAMPGELDYTDLFALAGLNRPELRDKPWHPLVPTGLIDIDTVIDEADKWERVWTGLFVRR